MDMANLERFLRHYPAYVYTWCRDWLIDFLCNRWEDLLNCMDNKIPSLLPLEEAFSYEGISHFPTSNILHLFKLYCFITQTKTQVPVDDILIDHETFLRRIPNLWISPCRNRFTRLFSHDQTYVKFSDFVGLMSAFTHFCPISTRYEVFFNILDADEDGFIGVDDLVIWLKFVSDNSFTDSFYVDLSKAVISCMDHDKDKQISLSEFKMVMLETVDVKEMHYLCCKVPNLRLL